LKGNSTSTGKSKKTRHKKARQGTGRKMVSEFEMEVFGFMTGRAASKTASRAKRTA